MKFQSKNVIKHSSGPLVMGVLNVTPDSFSDGGRYTDVQAAIGAAQTMWEQGADIIDIGGESTRPGAQPVTGAQEIDRVLPVIQALRAETQALLSIDTSKAEVMQAACEAGADIINDVRALREPQAMQAAVDSGAAVCLMHMQGEPRTMQQAPDYQDVVAEVREFLAERVALCIAAGISRERIIIDPGFGFGKTLTHNLQLLARLPEVSALGFPVLVGLSRKSMFRSLLGLEDPAERVAASLGAATLAVDRGAAIIRTHDVAQTRQAIAVASALKQINNQSFQEPV